MMDLKTTRSNRRLVKAAKDRSTASIRESDLTRISAVSSEVEAGCRC
jgi:hypothetical protein